MSNSSPVRVLAQICMSTLLLSLGARVANATAGPVKALEGVWCSQQSDGGETIVQYSSAGSEVTAFTMLSELDPRLIGSQASMHLTAEAPNVFVHHSPGGGDEIFSVQSDRLTVNSLWIWNRGTSKEMRQVMATQTYYKCDVGQALRRAQAFLSSPQAEQATRAALQREEDAALEERRNASKDAYYAAVIRQLNQVRTRVSL